MRRRDPAVLAAIAVTTPLWPSAFVAIRSARAQPARRVDNASLVIETTGPLPT